LSVETEFQQCIEGDPTERLRRSLTSVSGLVHIRCHHSIDGSWDVTIRSPCLSPVLAVRGYRGRERPWPGRLPAPEILVLEPKHGRGRGGL